MLEINELRRRESEKSGSHWELNPGHLRLEPPVAVLLSHDSWTTTNPHNHLYALVDMVSSHAQPFSEGLHFLTAHMCLYFYCVCTRVLTHLYLYCALDLSMRL